MAQHLRPLTLVGLFLLVPHGVAKASTHPQDLGLKAQSRVLVEQAKALTNIGRYDEAHTLLDRVMLKTPRFAPLYHQRAIIHRDQGLYEAAKRSLSRSIDLNPKPAEAWWDRCRVNRILKDLESATFDCQAAVVRNPQEITIRYLSEIYIEREQGKLAYETLKDGLRKTTISKTLMHDLVELAQTTERLTDLDIWLQKMSSRSSLRTKWLILYSEMLKKTGHVEPAGRTLHKALKVATKMLNRRKSADHYFWRARAYQAAGNANNAVLDAHEAKRRAPNDTRIQDLLRELDTASAQS